MGYPPLPRSAPSMPIPPGMRLVRQSAPIETTTFSDERSTYVTRDVLLPLEVDAFVHGLRGTLRSRHIVCSYCGRHETYGTQCNGCGAQVR